MWVIFTAKMLDFMFVCWLFYFMFANAESMNRNWLSECRLLWLFWSDKVVVPMNLWLFDVWRHISTGLYAYISLSNLSIRSHACVMCNLQFSVRHLDHFLKFNRSHEFFFVFWIKRLVCRQWEANICPLLLTIFGLKKWQDLCWILTCCYGNFLLNDKFVVYWIILGFLWAKTRHGKYDISTDNLYVTYI